MLHLIVRRNTPGPLAARRQHVLNQLGLPLPLRRCR